MYSHGNMFLNTLILLFFHMHTDYAMASSHKQPVHTIWSEFCHRNKLALNDCNWCKCSRHLRYICNDRVCSSVDMFGHFNDAIQNMDVGMEGKGVWRSSNTACEPGVHYQKGDLLCVCTEDGIWPNPVCRDVFQVLHAVEPTSFKDTKHKTCTPNKLYQVKCNVCYCPPSGQLDRKNCTNRNCTKDTVEKDALTNDVHQDLSEEIYAACERAKKYQIGCKTCVCLPNNRLLCDNCTSVSNVTVKIQVKGKPDDNTNSNLCSNKVPGKRFKRGCNICYCDQKDILYCTVFKCLEADTKLTLPKTEFESANAPIDNHDCIPGTKYTRDCNTCYCFKKDDIKYFGCTINVCEHGSYIKSDDSGCVNGTTYEKNCLICYCMSDKDGRKEFCTYNDKCRMEDKKPNTITSLDDIHGYCEPLHVYDQDCNKCRCLTDGKTVACTSKICSMKLSLPKAMVVEFIPFIQKKNVCPKGHKYKIDCNLCHCMSNGNALCTTNSCTGNDKVKQLE